VIGSGSVGGGKGQGRGKWHMESGTWKVTTERVEFTSTSQLASEHGIPSAQQVRGGLPAGTSHESKQELSRYKTDGVDSGSGGLVHRLT
jgi:hypothetical protein